MQKVPIRWPEEHENVAELCFPTKAAPENCLNVLSVNQDLNFSVVDAFVAPVAVLKRKQPKKKNHWWQRSVCLRREPLLKEENSVKIPTFSLTTSAVAFQIRPTAVAGNWHVLAVRCVHDRQHRGPMFNTTPTIICFSWPGPTHVHPTGGFPFFVLRVHLVHFPESDKGKKKKSPWWERWFIMSGNRRWCNYYKRETIWRHFHILREWRHLRFFF